MSLRYRWSTGVNIATLALAGEDEWLVAQRRKRRADGVTRGVLYHVFAGNRSNQVECFGSYRSLVRAQIKGEEVADLGGFSIDVMTAIDQPWHHRSRLSIKLIRKLALLDIQYRPGMTVAEATDLVAITFATRLIRDSRAGTAR
jgi:hypothetical protein